MVAQSRIEWTNSSWNPVTGCDPVSAGCEHCYAERMARRLQAMGVHKYRNGFEVTIHPETLEEPLRWKKPRIIFVNSMSDLFHRKIPASYRRDVFEVMRKADWHIFQVLTKRSKDLLKLSGKLDWPPNVWMGVTCENEHYKYRIDDLHKVPASVRFLSLEPLQGPLGNLNLSEINWAVVGGESGPGARPMERKWVVDIRRQCRASGVNFFFKQWGGVNKKAAGRLLDKKIYSEMPPLVTPASLRSDSQMSISL